MTACEHDHGDLVLVGDATPMTRRCAVCASSAPIIRESAERGTLELCYHHEGVCWEHLADPCPACEGEAGSGSLALLVSVPGLVAAVVFVAHLAGAYAGSLS